MAKIMKVVATCLKCGKYCHEEKWYNGRWQRLTFCFLPNDPHTPFSRASLRYVNWKLELLLSSMDTQEMSSSFHLTPGLAPSWI